MLSFRQPFTVSLHDEDFEDFIVIPIVQDPDLDKDFNIIDAVVIDNSPIRWSQVSRVMVYGFPTELNEPDYVNGVISYQPVRLDAMLTGNGVGDGMHEVRCNINSPLTSFDGLSGSPVFADDRIIGVILRGSPETKVSTILHFLDVRAVHSAIQQSLKEHVEHAPPEGRGEAPRL